MGIILVLLFLWLALAVVGVLVKGLLWLAIIAAVLFLVTGGWGLLRHPRARP